MLPWLVLLDSQGLEPGPGSPGSPGPSAERGTLVLPPAIPDPLEPFNRTIWAFNKGLMIDVIKPTSVVYRALVRKPIRTGIGNFGRNLTYPGRLINNLLQARWRGARDESVRFAWNTTAGVAGFLDVATKRGISKADADFGLTFGHWGWEPDCFVMLPILGASSERDTLGLAGDTAANPLLYVSPYNFVAGNPLSWLGPYTYFTYVDRYNGLSDSVRRSARFARSEMDPYATIQFASSFARRDRVVAMTPNGESDAAANETLKSVLANCRDPGFPDRGRTRSVVIPATGRSLQFTSWMQPGKAPVIYIVPGLGSHRLSQHSLVLAELVHDRGFSAVCVSSAFHSEFMENASTAALPANLAVDSRDVHAALTEIDRRLTDGYPGRLGDRALLGFSMGAMHALVIAAVNETDRSSLMTFDRCVALDTPVSLVHGLARLDEFYRAPLAWPEAERMKNMEDVLLKAATLLKGSLTPETILPFGAVESKFLIGLTFRFLLRDVVFSSQRRSDLGVLQFPIRNLRRAPVYAEILRYSYRDYLEKFAVPHYASRGAATPVAEVLERAGDLRTYEAGLRGNPAVRVIVNRNDFLLSDNDLAWLGATFDAGRLTLLGQGGHLGNLHEAALQRRILDALEGLLPPRTNGAPGR